MNDLKKIAIISDIHGNYTALKAVINKIDSYGDEIGEIMCLGDLVGYNPEPEKCVNEIRKVCSQVIAGNHDKTMVDELNTDWFREPVKKSINWTKSRLTASSLSYLKSLDIRKDLEIKDKKIILAHGSPNREAPFTYIFNNYDIKKIEPHIMNTDLLFIGHTHIPFCFYDQDDWTKLNRKMVKIEANHTYVINVGSVGQPRDRNPKASFVIYDLKQNTINFQRVEYDIEEVQNKFQDTDLPEEFSIRLKQGR